jgi:hypothetical protein
MPPTRQTPQQPKRESVRSAEKRPIRPVSHAQAPKMKSQSQLILLFLPPITVLCLLMYYVLHSTYQTHYLCYAQLIKNTQKFKNMNTMKQLLKRTILLSALMLTLGLSYSFATPAKPATSTDEITGDVKASFNKEFKNAQVLNWDVSRKFIKVTFKMNDMILFAFFSGNGQLLAVTRNIVSSQLPISLIRELKQGYTDFWVTDLFEINGDEENCYYITLENADSKLVLRSIDNEKWEVYETKNKK